MTVGGLDCAAVCGIMTSTGREVDALNGMQQLASEMDGVLQRKFKVAAALLRLLSLPSNLLSQLSQPSTDLSRVRTAFESFGDVTHGNRVALEAQHPTEEPDLPITGLFQTGKNVDFVTRSYGRFLDALLIVIADGRELSIELILHPGQRGVFFLERLEQGGG